MSRPSFTCQHTMAPTAPYDNCRLFPKAPARLSVNLRWAEVMASDSSSVAVAQSQVPWVQSGEGRKQAHRTRWVIRYRVM
jgi:hypothetical protein